ncbi:putative drug exporter of the RND superfamily [Frankia sp. AiPs1]|uniref:MMPL family transporter n=1 Tax=Frankia sp. AiPa1 TaxID=573492 RepID=UPI00202AC33B|nr:MMPL family transporter [Frankia sp. AiPa1]MCL9759451.1 MMPL family transporter [Frankia sp. AiPa1]
MRSTPRTSANLPGQPARPGQPDWTVGPPDGQGPPGRHPTHLAARAARWSVRHRKLAVGGWVLGVVLAIFVGGLIGTHTITDADEGIGESGRAEKTLTAHGWVDTDSENVLIQRSTPAADAQTLLADPQIRATVSDTATRIQATGVAVELRAPIAAPGARTDPGLVSHDLRSVLVTFDLKGDADDHAKVEPTLDAVKAVQAAHPGVSVEQFGDASSDKALSATVGKDFHRAEFLAIPLTLGILLAVFGAVVAALIPMALALTSFVAALGLVAFASRAFPTDETATSVMLLIGLAVGVDYALFYIRREREERAAGHSPERALEIAADTSGHAVLTSGLTVAVSMAGLFLTGMATFTGVAVGTIIVVLVAVLGSITVLPALLSMLGDRVELLRLPWRRRRGATVRRGGRRARSHGPRHDGAGEATIPGQPGPAHLAGPHGDAGDAGDAVIDPRDELLARRRVYQAQLVKPGVMGRLLRRPKPVAVITGGLLLLLALPALGMHTAEPGVDDIPRKLPIMKTYERLSDAFPGGQVAASVVVSSTDGSRLTTAAAQHALDDLHRRAVASGRMFEPVSITYTPDHQVAKVEIPVAGSGTNGESAKALHVLRSTVIPATFGAASTGARTNLHADVTGTTADSVDFNDRLHTRTPLIIGFVLVLAFLLLLAAFRSALVAAVAVGLNLLSVGAAYGLLVAVFQHHWADGLLGYTSTGAITIWLPLMLFVILFGLSMDYQVFVLSRVREAREAGLPMRDAVTVGVRRSAGVVTSAAVIMVAVFSIFATLSQVSMKQLGVGLGAAILLDATLIRVVLMPAVLTLLENRLWRDRSADDHFIDDHFIDDGSLDHGSLDHGSGRPAPGLPGGSGGSGGPTASLPAPADAGHTARTAWTDGGGTPVPPRYTTPADRAPDGRTGAPRPSYPTPRWSMPPA